MKKILVREYKTDELEPLAVPLVQALDRLPGIYTIMSCGGHLQDNLGTRFPWFSFSILKNELDEGLNSLTLLHNASRSFTWVVTTEGVVRVNQDSKKIPPLLQQEPDNYLTEKEIYSNFILLPIKALTVCQNHLSPAIYHSPVEADVEAEQIKISKIAEFIETYNNPLFSFELEKKLRKK